jgi:hypothetical protein
MKIAALIFGLLGVVGSGFLGVKWTGEGKDPEKLEALKKLNEIAQDAKVAADLKEIDMRVKTCYVLIGGAVAGLLGVVLMLMDKGKVAALLFLVGFGASVAIYKNPVIVIFTFGLALAAVFAFLAKPKMAHSRVRQEEAKG